MPEFQHRSFCLVGDELRIILETSNWHRRWDSHCSKTSLAKGWLITIDLSKQGPIAGRSRVIGPLWDVANERSSLSFDAGAHFTKQDVAAARATPFIDFEPDGTVVRIRADANGVGMIREHLVLDAHPVWKLDGPFLPLPPPGPPMNEDTVQKLSRRYQLQLSGGITTLHELMTGKRISDPWLETAFTAFRKQEELQNVRTWLTDDLNYYSERDIARLVPFGAGPGYEISPPRADWELMNPQRIQLLEKPNRLAFFGTNIFDEAVDVSVWDLHQGTVSTYEAPTGELFSARAGEYSPKAATKVETLGSDPRREALSGAAAAQVH